MGSAVIHDVPYCSMICAGCSRDVACCQQPRDRINQRTRCGLVNTSPALQCPLTHRTLGTKITFLFYNSINQRRNKAEASYKLFSLSCQKPSSLIFTLVRQCRSKASFAWLNKEITWGGTKTGGGFQEVFTGPSCSAHSAQNREGFLTGALSLLNIGISFYTKT